MRLYGIENIFNKKEKNVTCIISIIDDRIKKLKSEHIDKSRYLQ